MHCLSLPNFIPHIFFKYKNLSQDIERLPRARVTLHAQRWGWELSINPANDVGPALNKQWVNVPVSHFSMRLDVDSMYVIEN